MTDKEEIESQHPPDPATEENPESADAPAEKEEKPKASKEKKPRKPRTLTHPPYFLMIKDALLALNEKSGSSPYAIAKFVEQKHKSVLPANFRKTLASQLKNLASKGKLVKIRASYKLSPETARKPRSKTSTRARSSPTRPKTMSVNKPDVATTKKKRSGTRKAKPRQPRSIKSPSAKKAMRASASS